MVMEIETHRSLEDSTLLADPLAATALDQRDAQAMRFDCLSPQARDTSTARRDGSLDDVRQSLTHTSILNLTSDAEDEDDEEEHDDHRSFLFGGENQDPSGTSLLVAPEPPVLTPPRPRLPETTQNSTRAPKDAPATPVSLHATIDAKKDRLESNAADWLDTSIEAVTESFVESLCPSSSGDDSCATSLQQVCDQTVRVGRHLQRQIELDILSLLGCPTDPTDDELDAWVTPLFLWNTSPPSTPMKLQEPSPARPFRRNPKERAERIRLWRNMTCLEQPWPKQQQSVDDLCLGPPQTKSLSVVKPKSNRFSMLLDDDPLDLFIGKGMEPIPSTDNDLGYDSDPEEITRRAARVVTPTAQTLEFPSEEHKNNDYVPYDVHRMRVAEEMKHVMVPDQDPIGLFQAIQESLNYTWALTWHPASGQTPIAVDAWIERGSLLNYGSVVVEPKFMWRNSFHPKLASARKLHDSKPTEVRVLNACRILEATQEPDRTKYPLARTQCSFYLKTCLGEEFLLEAASPQERAVLVHQWKLVVARMASLAVMDDMDTLALEFFTPVVTSQMLTTNAYSRARTY